MIAWEGASLIDGGHVVLILTGIDGDSRNPKTGPMVQGWIMRADISPLDALATGADVSICGGCRHRPQGVGHRGSQPVWNRRSCYVNPMGLQTTWHQYQAGRYSLLDPESLRGKLLRMGGYGDPCAVPEDLWRHLLSVTAGHTGYTHQWRNRRFQAFKEWCMASVDTVDELDAAMKMGWSTFRVLAEGEENHSFETTCPASAEGGRITTCSACLRCDGHRDHGVTIKVHGPGAIHFRHPQIGMRL